MFNCLATHTHRLRVLIKTLLHGFEHVFVLPSCDPAFRTCRAARGDITTTLSPCRPPRSCICRSAPHPPGGRAESSPACYASTRCRRARVVNCLLDRSYFLPPFNS